MHDAPKFPLHTYPRNAYWILTAFYTEDAEVLAASDPGRRGAQPGEFALEVWVANDHFRDVERDVFTNRPEIGDVIITAGPRHPASRAVRHG